MNLGSWVQKVLVTNEVGILTDHNFIAICKNMFQEDNKKVFWKQNNSNDVH